LDRYRTSFSLPCESNKFVPANISELQIVLVDPAGSDLDEAIGVIGHSGAARVQAFHDVDEAKMEVMQFPGPTLVIFFVPESRQGMVNYVRFFRRSVAKQVEIVF